MSNNAYRHGNNVRCSEAWCSETLQVLWATYSAELRSAFHGVVYLGSQLPHDVSNIVMCLHLNGDTSGPQKWPPKWAPVASQVGGPGRVAELKKTLEHTRKRVRRRQNWLGPGPQFGVPFRDDFGPLWGSNRAPREAGVDPFQAPFGFVRGHLCAPHRPHSNCHMVSSLSIFNRARGPPRRHFQRLCKAPFGGPRRYFGGWFSSVIIK